MDDSQVAFDERGLVPCVVQDWRTGEVLTLAYMNAEALARTRETGEMHFWSRSRDELWHKGETSGNVQTLKAIRYDCDADALLALVEPAGPPVTPASARASTAATWSSPRARRSGARARARRPGGSAPRRLLHGRPPRRPGAPRRQGPRGGGRGGPCRRGRADERVAEEAADVLYHLAVLLRARGVDLADVEEVLNGRRG